MLKEITMMAPPGICASESIAVVTVSTMSAESPATGLNMASAASSKTRTV